MPPLNELFFIQGDKALHYVKDTFNDSLGTNEYNILFNDLK